MKKDTFKKKRQTRVSEIIKLIGKTFDELLEGAQTIHDNEIPDSNTNQLVGGQLIDMVEKMKEMDEKFEDLKAYLKTKNLGNNLTFNAAYIGESLVKRIRRSGNNVSFEFILNIIPGADMYNKQVVLCANIPVTDIDLEDLENEIIPFNANYIPAADEISRTSSFSITAYSQGSNIYCMIINDTSETQLAQIVLTANHIIDHQENEFNTEIKKEENA
ncbi:hypothetical protein EZS27_027357 [termite gut metagenome]|uniref:Uncharacterized protein n=1 Tax=termite gut metagenome TaxID=433724 RepID=A0A5J4QML7_9ZZZZ